MSEVGDLPWKFYFKLYCFLDTDNVPKDSVEFAFMFEQVQGMFRNTFLYQRAGRTLLLMLTRSLSSTLKTYAH